MSITTYILNRNNERHSIAGHLLTRMAVAAVAAVTAAGVSALAPTSAQATLLSSCGGATYGRVLVNGPAWSGLPASRGDLNVYDNAACFPNNWESVGTYGLHWQCTELAARWADVAWEEGGYQNWEATGWTGSAKDMWRVAPLLRVPLTRYANGGLTPPQKGDLLVISDGGVGHVAVVSGVSGGRLFFVGENQGRAGGSSSIPISGTTANSAGWLIGSTVVGWMRGPSSPFASPFDYRVDGVSVEGPNNAPIDVSHAWIGEHATMVVAVTNTGTSAWDSNVRIGVPQGVASHLSDPEWFNPLRPAAVVGTVAANASYTFRFPITIGASTTGFVDQFNLVDEQVTWFSAHGINATISYQKTGDFAVVTRHHGAGGYQVAPDGTITAFGGAPVLANSATIWPDFDIARGLVLRSDDSGGYVLDGYGGLHPFGTAPAITSSVYWPGWDIARGLVLRSDDSGGYILDGYGGLHPFGTAPAITSSVYWPGWDIARGVTLRNDNTGVDVVDGAGGLHEIAN